MNLESDRNQKISYVLKESTALKMQELMKVDDINNEQVWVTRLIKRYYALGPAKRAKPASPLRSLRSKVNDSTEQHWLKLTIEEKKQLEALCEYYDFVNESRKPQFTKYRYSALIYHLISNTYYSRMAKAKKRLDEQVEKQRQNYDINKLIDGLEGD